MDWEGAGWGWTGLGWMPQWDWMRLRMGAGGARSNIWGRAHPYMGSAAPNPHSLTQVANAIAQARETAAWPGDKGNHVDATMGDEDEEDEEEGSPPTLLFETLQDWERELQRLGAAGWRVSAVNERFDMAPSLPRYLWVPNALLDHDLKRTFAHFQERRVRLCWHHPNGSDLLRAASFHAASEPGSEDIRCLEVLLGAGCRPCVLADTAELPTPQDIQLAHLRLRALCLPADEKWLSALEGTRWLEHVRSCLRKAVEVASLLAGRRCSVVLQEPSDRDLGCLLASLVQLLLDPHSRSLHGFQSLIQREWVAMGHPFPQRLGLSCSASHVGAQCSSTVL
uniref:Myotubularin related protein 11 n=1 Tax=Coturnix japonica TaxID=93934 RepID=A0A8C2TQ29_COTJA